MADGLDAAAFAGLARATLTVMRPAITEAWVDAMSALSWPSGVSAALDLVVDLGRVQRTRKSHGTLTAIDLDLTRTDHFEALVQLSPYTIHAEAYAGREWVWSVNDTGDNLFATLSPPEFQAVASPVLRPSTR